MRKNIELKDRSIEIGIGDELWFNANDLAKMSYLSVHAYMDLPRTHKLINRLGKCAFTSDGVLWFKKEIALDFAKWQGAEQYSTVRDIVLAEKPFTPKVVDYENMITVSSLDVAEAFEKEHKHVLEAIKKSDCSEDFMKSNYRPSQYIDNEGVKQPCIMMTRDGFSFLVMGFTGKAAARFKEIYIKAFNDMEQKLKANTALVLPNFTNPAESARAWADQYEARMIAEAKAEENKEKAQGFELLIEKADNYTLQEAADLLGTGRTRFAKWLKQEKYLQNDRIPYQSSIRSGWFIIKERTANDIVYHTPMITPKGMEYFTRIRNKGGMDNFLNKVRKTLDIIITNN